jgi:hypothetical protein
MIRVTAQLEGFKAENATLDIAVKELREALAAASAQNACLERIYTEADVAGLARKLNDRDRALAASRGRAAALQQRINAAAGHLEHVRLVLVDTITE